MNLGNGGQEFIDTSLNKIKELRAYIDANNLDVDIEVDGGINDKTIKQIQEVGADICSCGSYLANSEDYTKTVKELKEI